MNKSESRVMLNRIFRLAYRYAENKNRETLNALTDYDNLLTDLAIHSNNKNTNFVHHICSMLQTICFNSMIYGENIKPTIDRTKQIVLENNYF